MQGNQDQRIQNFNHDKISTFGIGKEYDKFEWQSIFRQLVAMDLLRVDIAGHGGIEITNAGHEFLRQKDPLRLSEYVAGKKAIKEKLKQDNKTTEKLPSKDRFELKNQPDQDLFNLLRAKRLEISKAQKLPPYIIFHDRTLLEMVKYRPKSMSEMLKISGVGEAKFKSYGEAFLEVINANMTNTKVI